MIRRSRWAAGAAALVLALAGCGVDSFDFATPPDTTAPATTSTTAAPDLTGATEATVPGSTSTGDVAIQPGQAELTGTVLGPSGPVAGATVEADRYVGDAMASLKVVTGPDGSWTMTNLIGGRFRVRAWLAPTLAMGVPQIFFLGATQSMPVPLTLSPYTTQSVSSSANPTSAPVGDGINVAVLVEAQTVGTDGFVRYEPSPGVTVQLSAGGAVQVGADPLVTDGRGIATFTLTCVSDGSASGVVTSASGTTSQLPGLSCYTLTAPSSTSSTTTPSGSTTTTVAGGGAGGSSTTSSTTGLGGLLP